MLTEKARRLDPTTFAVLAAKFDATVREMTLTMTMTSRSVILSAARDFSCSILTTDCRIVSQLDCLPIQSGTCEYAIAPITEAFAGDIQPGDCFFNNSPYHGNAHVGDFSMGVPVFYKGELIFWVGNRAHQLDCGAYLPSSANPSFKDVYEEGLHIPPLRVQRNYRDIKDVINLFRANIRYPTMWYGDFLAQVGSLRVGEKRLTELCDKYGVGTVRQFLEEYIDYADRRMADEIRKLPKATSRAEEWSDPFPYSPKGIRVVAKLTLDPDAALITVDLTESDDQVPSGLNCTEASATAASMTGVLQCLDPTIPRNHGCFKHIKVILREGSVAGKPIWPAGTSCATTSIPDRVTNVVLNAFTQAVPERGHGGAGLMCAQLNFIAGFDFRNSNQPYGAIPLLAVSGGPPSKGYDGWPNYWDSGVSGVMYMEPVELHELRHPHLIKQLKVVPDSGGAGQWRGGTATHNIIQPIKTGWDMISGGDAHKVPSFGALDGKPGGLADHWIADAKTGEVLQRLPGTGVYRCEEGQEWHLITSAGGGYGDPLERDPELVRSDAREGLISLRAAREDYGVVLNTEPEQYEVDHEATQKLRQKLRKKREVT